jgi:hypothetical protein
MKLTTNSTGEIKEVIEYNDVRIALVKILNAHSCDPREQSQELRKALWDAVFELEVGDMYSMIEAIAAIIAISPIEPSAELKAFMQQAEALLENQLN